MNIFKKEPNFKFLNKRYYAFALSLAVILPGIFLWRTQGFRMGIDFSGGTLAEVAFRDKTSVSSIRAALRTEDLADAEITQIDRGNKFFIKTKKTFESGGKGAGQDFEAMARRIRDALRSPEDSRKVAAGMIDLNNVPRNDLEAFLRQQGVEDADARAAGEIVERVKEKKQMLSGVADLQPYVDKGLKRMVYKTLDKSAFAGGHLLLSMEVVGPFVGKALRNKATLACIWALAGILVYIAFRFKFLYGLSGILTLAHDVLVSLSFVLFFKIEMSMQVIAAILTIVGYSINDTIVVFDRLRENLKIMRKDNMETILDKSLNQTLSRSIITSLTVFLTVLALYIFGGEVIRPFAFVMLVGVIAGSYSTIFQSCAWLKIWEKALLKRKNY